MIIRISICNPLGFTPQHPLFLYNHFIFQFDKVETENKNGGNCFIIPPVARFALLG